LRVKEERKEKGKKGDVVCMFLFRRTKREEEGEKHNPQFSRSWTGKKRGTAQRRSSLRRGKGEKKERKDCSL